MSSLDHPHMEHTRDALWGHLTDEGEGGYLSCRVEDAKASLVLMTPVLSHRPVRVWARMACRYLRDGARVDALQLLGIIKLCHNDLKMEGRIEFDFKLEVRRLDDLEEEPPRVSSQEGPNSVRPEEDAAPFHFFKAGTAVFLPCRGVRRRCGVDGGGGWASAIATGVSSEVVGCVRVRREERGKRWGENGKERGARVADRWGEKNFGG
ncbi:hypothetical protein GOBAR_AA29012 [Gossypium barbadense]|uniref:Uncharacterized protein n=1 Tax=Gossypium barbadense TaxID=3634 RepID=A0A2P5WKT9_GOSBA|nr:hypothetical protein GOBAR_AA29012 [Gossypium barbadense]